MKPSKQIHEAVFLRPTIDPSEYKLTRWILPILAAFLLFACHDDKAPSSTSGIDLMVFSRGSQAEEAFRLFFLDTPPPLIADPSGSGAFGSWIVDARGNPAYQYTMDQHNNPLASYFTSWGESQDHWHQLGNDTITATAHNDGYVQFWDWTRGGKCINRYQPEKNNFSGGFKFIKMGQESWNTLYHSSDFEIFERSFGMGYVEKKTQRNKLKVRERLYVPYGKDPVIISETEITNLNDTPVEISVYEYWDVNLYELLLAPITTAPLGELFDALRWRFNNRFQVTTAFEAEQQVLSASIKLKPGNNPPPREGISIEDYYPVTTFLAPIMDPPDAYYTDQQAFWGNGLLDNPDALQFEVPSNLLAPDSPDIGAACLIFRRDHRLEAHETLSTAYIYGYSSGEKIPGFISTYRDNPANHFENTISSWSRVEARFVVPEIPWLTRETLWHGYYLMSGAFYEDYFSSHIINQGSAYGYNQGINGAHRDFALFCLPVVYLRPDLAREILAYTMKSQDGQTGKIPYGHQGYGFTSGYIIHDASSDLDLFFMLAMAEYLAATRDFDFLDAVFPYYPRDEAGAAPVKDHLVKAMDHLENEVNTGPNGLIRVGSGDWNDVLVAYSTNPLFTMLFGESNLNSAMACFVLPKLAGLLEDRMPQFSKRLYDMAEDLAWRLQAEWTGKWMRRGSLGS